MEDDVPGAYASSFEAMLVKAFRRFGEVDGLPVAMRDAVASTPRHRFVHRFRLQEGGEVQDADTDLAGNLATIYSDISMAHVDEKGAILPSTNSQPSYVLWLLLLLGIATGDRVLEIGSGSGWLAAIMGRLVGPTGRVVGMEVIPELAAQSRSDLAALGASNVDIATGDAATRAPSEVFDVVMITAGVWDLPRFLFDQVRPGGRVLAPIELRGSSACHVAVLRREHDRFVAGRVTRGFFVPLIGGGQEARPGKITLQCLESQATLEELPLLKRSLPLGLSLDSGDNAIAREFLAYLGRTESGLVVFKDDGSAIHTDLAFGLEDELATSRAIWRAGEIKAFGNQASSDRMLGAYRRWSDSGLPASSAWNIEISRASPDLMAGQDEWLEHRGSTTLVWRLERPRSVTARP